MTATIVSSMSAGRVLSRRFIISHPSRFPDRAMCPCLRIENMGYHDHYVVDGGKARIILHMLVTPADVILLAKSRRAINSGHDCH